MGGKAIPDRRQGAEVVAIMQAAPDPTASRLELTYRENRDALVSFLEFRLGSAGEAEDIAQAAFTQLWSRKSELHDKNLAALLFVTARNIATDALRRRIRSPVSRHLESQPGEHSGSVADDAPTAERILIARRDLALVTRLLDELPPRCREAFISYKFLSLDYGEIALSMRVTESMVRKYVRKALLHCVSRYAELDAWE